MAGAFSLVRFRSAPGTAREIGTLFAAMGMGLIMGMGYVGYAVLFTFLIGLAMLIIYSKLSSDEKKETSRRTSRSRSRKISTIRMFSTRSSKIHEVLQIKPGKDQQHGISLQAQLRDRLKGSFGRKGIHRQSQDQKRQSRDIVSDTRLRNGTTLITISKGKTAMKHIKTEHKLISAAVICSVQSRLSPLWQDRTASDLHEPHPLGPNVQASTSKISTGSSSRIKILRSDTTRVKQIP